MKKSHNKHNKREECLSTKLTFGEEYPQFYLYEPPDKRFLKELMEEYKKNNNKQKNKKYL